MMATEMTQEMIDSWRSALVDFEDVYRAVFQRRGITRDTALLAWEINSLKNAVHSVEDMIAEFRGHPPE